jgi:mono/diheme cytochrome c family protein
MTLRFLYAAVFAASASAAGSTQVSITPKLVEPSLAGRDTFAFYCASCHGRDGTGNGPVGSALKAKPANLTKLAARNGGTYPVERVRAFVAKGQPGIPAHGSPDMPVWGPVFQVLDPSDKLAEARIENVVAYIKSIQTK